MNRLIPVVLLAFATILFFGSTSYAEKNVVPAVTSTVASALIGTWVGGSPANTSVTLTFTEVTPDGYILGRGVGGNWERALGKSINAGEARAQIVGETIRIDFGASGAYTMNLVKNQLVGKFEFRGNQSARSGTWDVVFDKR